MLIIRHLNVLEILQDKVHQLLLIIKPVTITTMYSILIFMLDERVLVV